MKPLLADVNVLFPLLYSQELRHVKALGWAQRQAPQPIVICRLVQLGVMRLLGNSTILGKNAMTSLAALDLTLGLMEHEGFEFWPEPPNLVPIFRSLLRYPVPTTKLINDAYLAAFAISANLRLATFDSGFRQFPGLDLELLA